MDAFNNLMYGFGIALEPINIAYVFAGVFAGTIIGMLPGLGPISAGNCRLLLVCRWHSIGYFPDAGSAAALQSRRELWSCRVLCVDGTGVNGGGLTVG